MGEMRGTGFERAGKNLGSRYFQAVPRIGGAAASCVRAPGDGVDVELAVKRGVRSSFASVDAWRRGRGGVAVASAIVAFIAGGAGSGCKRPSSLQADASSTPRALDAAPETRATSTASYAAGPRAPRPPCRVMATKGVVTQDADDDDDAGRARAVKLGDRVTDDGWLTLAPAASLTVEDGRSGRDVLLEGAAQARLCVGDEEETWLARGTFESSPGSGEVPGAEEWVVTPMGVVRYSGAKVTVTADDARATAQVKGGVAFAYLTHPHAPPAEGEPGAVDHWARIDVGKTLDLGARDDSVWRTRDDAARCASMANGARDLADRLHNPTDPSIIAVMGPKHVAARLVARAACAVAALRVDRLASTPANANVKGELTSVIRVADSSWRGAP